MIVVGLFGRLGNQMFQYAAGRSLACHLGVSLGLDPYFGGNETPSPFLLDKMNIYCESIPKILLPPRKDSAPFLRRLWKKGFLYPKIFLEGKNLGYNPKFNFVSDNTYLLGWWQSEKYFNKYKEVIRSDFEFTVPLNSQNLDTLNEILETPTSISLHVRRGDYLEEIHKSIFGSCSKSYYENAVLQISKDCQLPPPTVFVFSDDPEWVSKNFKLPYHIRIISHNSPQNAFEDLRLMSNCKHHIIANSSFSWWGAWLGKNENKIIVAPETWYKSSKHSNPDIWCDNWIRIPNT